MSTNGKFYTDGEIANIKGIAMNHGVEVGRKDYQESSPETKRFMETTAMEIKYIKDEVSEIKTRIVDKDAMKLLIKEAQDEVLKCAEERFAKNWVEKVVGGMVALILTGVVIALLALVIR